MENIGKILMVAGGIILLAGLIIYFAGDKLGWIGHLPGDINIVRDNVRVYIPITTMILLSAVLSVIIYLIKKIM